jgi:hypothetical protein
MQVFSFTLLPLYSRGKSSRYPFDRRLNDVEKRKFLTLPGLELLSLGVQTVASRYTEYDIPFYASKVQ